MPHTLVDNYQRFGGTLSAPSSGLKQFNPKNGGDIFLQKAGHHLQDYTASKPKRPPQS
jgi:hypothetical protein